MAQQVISPRPILCAVLDGAAFGSDPGQFARMLFRAGVDWIQLRDRSLDAKSMLRLARQLVEARDADRAQSTSYSTSQSTQENRRVIVNRRIDLALSAEADGVHLGFDALSPSAARSLLGERALIGASLHSVAEVESFAAGFEDEFGEASYAHLAPIWNPISKPATRPGLGTKALATACQAGLPLLAQGGMDPAHAAEAVLAGAAGIAVTGILTAAWNPIEVTRQLRDALDRVHEPTADEKSSDGQNSPEG